MPWSAPSTYNSQGNTGYLAQIELGTYASPPSYTATVNVRALTVSEFGSVPNVDVSTLLSPNNTKEIFGGMANPGTIEIDGVFTADTTQIQLYTWLKGSGTGPTILSWEIVSPILQYTKTYTASGVGFISKFSVGPFELDKAIDFKATIQITGQVNESIA